MVAQASRGTASLVIAGAALPPQLASRAVGTAPPPPGPPDPQAFVPSLHGPVLVRAAPHVHQLLHNATSRKHGTVPFNDPSAPFEYETELFSGRALVLLRHLPQSPAGVFDGKRRTCYVVVQGQFKRPVRADALIMGADFQHPLRLPPKLFLAGTRLGGWIARRAGGSAALQLRGPRPYAHSRVITAAQAIHASRTDQPPPDLLSAPEDLRLLDPTCADQNGDPLCMGRRRAHFNRGGRASEVYFMPGHVYTITFYNQEMDYSTFKARAPFLGCVDMVRLLNGGPSMFMLRAKRVDASGALSDSETGGAEDDGGGGGCGWDGGEKSGAPAGGGPGGGQRGGVVLHVEVWHERMLELLRGRGAQKQQQPQPQPQQWARQPEPIVIGERADCGGVGWPTVGDLADLPVSARR